MSSKGKISALSIIALILGAGGLGFGLFSTIRFQTVQGPEGPEGPEGPPGNDGEDGNDGVDGTLDNLVSIWTEVNSSLSSEFNISLHGNVYNDTTYISMIDNETFMLTQIGWYRLSIMFLIDGLAPTSNYELNLKKNGAYHLMLQLVLAPPDTIFVMDAETYVRSDGDDLFYFSCDSAPSDDFVVDAFQPLSTLVVVEFVGNV